MKKFDPAELRRTKDRRQKEEGRMTRLHSYLNFAGTAEEAFGFYRSVFGGEFSSLVRFRDLPIEGVSMTRSSRGC